MTNKKTKQDFIIKTNIHMYAQTFTHKYYVCLYLNFVFDIMFRIIVSLNKKKSDS